MSRKQPTPPPYKPGDTVIRPAAPPCPPAPRAVKALEPWTWDQAKEFCLRKEIQFPVEAAHRAVEEYVRQQKEKQNGH